jgi:hypothetical protein
MSNLLTLSYWFNLNPGAWVQTNLRVISVLFGLLVIFGIMAWFFINKNKENKLVQKFWKKVQGASLTIGFVGLLLIFFRQQRVVFLSMPFLLLLNVVGGAVWAYFIFRYITKVVPEKKKMIEEKKAKDKYLP